MYSTATTTIFQSQTFSLDENLIDNKAIIGFGIFLLPTILAGIVFYMIFKLEGIELSIATGVTALMLMNIAFFILNKLDRNKTKLLIELDGIRLLKHSTLGQVIPFEKVNIINLKSTNHENTTPSIIQLDTANSSSVIIPRNSINKFGPHFKQEKSKKLFIINNHEDWCRLLHTLDQNI